jgi:hypothetical protein
MVDQELRLRSKFMEGKPGLYSETLSLKKKKKKEKEVLTNSVDVSQSQIIVT